MDEQQKSLVLNRNTFNALYNISQILNTGLTQEELILCVRLCEHGINPNMLAQVVRDMKNEVKNIKLQVSNKRNEIG